MIALLPLGLVAVGGGLGGAIAAVAVGLNLSIARGSDPTPIRVVSMLGTTVVAVAAWWGALTLIRALL